MQSARCSCFQDAGFFAPLSTALRVPAVLAVLLCGLAVHLTVLGNGFHYDDGHSILRNPHIRDLGNLAGFFSDPAMFSENPDYSMYRPLVLVSHALNYRLSGSLSARATGYEPAGYLAANLAIHLINSLLVLAILSHLTLSQSIRAFGALLFCLHPLQTEVVNYASARSESLAALFYLACVCCYLQSSSRDRGQRLWFGFSVAFFTCSLFTKEIAVTLPLCLLAVEWYLTRRSQRGWAEQPLLHSITRHWQRQAVFWAILCLYLVVYQSVTDHDWLSPSTAQEAVRSWESQSATQAKALVHYLLGAVFPVRLSVYPQFQESPVLLTPAPLLAASMIAMIGVCAWRFRRSVPAATLGISWFVMVLIPTSVIPLHILVNDHRPYLSLFGFTLAVGALTAHFLRRRRGLWCQFALCGLFALLAHQRDADWRTERTLWQDAALKGPSVPEAHFNLGHAHHEMGDLSAARVAYEHAVALSPDYTRAQINLGAIYREDGRLEHAIEAFERALAGAPSSIEALNNLGLTHASRGETATAIGLYERALTLQPDKAEVWLNLGLSLRDGGRREEAVAALSRALQLDPQIKHRFPAP